MLGSLEAIEYLSAVCHEGSDAHYLRQQYDERGSAEGMVDAALNMFRQH